MGAGLGGLALALRLAHRGHEVVVFEKTDQVGGRIRRLSVSESQFDVGPTLLMMREPFERLFSDVDERLEDHLDLTLCDPSYRTFFRDGTIINATIDRDEMQRQIRDLAGPNDAAAYRAWLNDLEELYRVAIPSFVCRNYKSPLDLANPKAVKLVMRHHMLSNLAKRTERYFRDPRLRMLFSFQTMYLGLSPFEAPWVYAVLAYMEYGAGIWFPRGGMAQVPETVARLAAERGAEIRLHTPVAAIEGPDIVLEDGTRERFDAVIANADLPYVEKELVGRPAKARRTYSCSAQMFYVDYAGELPELEHHNVFFGSDFRGNLEAIFNAPLSVPADPAFYACISSKTDPSLAAPGHSNLYLLAPCPNLDYRMSDAEVMGLKQVMFERLASVSSFDPSRVREVASWGPNDWAGDLNLDRGAAFGLSAHFRQSVAFRPSNQSRVNPFLYYVGASTVPGNGMPMVLISAELAEERLTATIES